MVKVYKILWAVLLTIIALTFLTGNLTMSVGVAFGFVIFGLIFSGMMFVLPSTVAHANHHLAPVKEIKKVKEKRKEFLPANTAHAR
jgi:uncharacterized protein (DUF58 family)